MVGREHFIYVGHDSLYTLLWIIPPEPVAKTTWPTISMETNVGVVVEPDRAEMMPDALHGWTVTMCHTSEHLIC